MWVSLKFNPADSRPSDGGDPPEDQTFYKDLQPYKLRLIAATWAPSPQVHPIATDELWPSQRCNKLFCIVLFVWFFLLARLIAPHQLFIPSRKYDKEVILCELKNNNNKIKKWQWEGFTWIVHPHRANKSIVGPLGSRAPLSWTGHRCSPPGATHNKHGTLFKRWQHFYVVPDGFSTEAPFPPKKTKTKRDG